MLDGLACWHLQGSQALQQQQLKSVSGAPGSRQQRFWCSIWPSRLPARLGAQGVQVGGSQRRPRDSQQGVCGYVGRHVLGDTRDVVLRQRCLPRHVQAQVALRHGHAVSLRQRSRLSTRSSKLA